MEEGKGFKRAIKEEVDSKVEKRKGPKEITPEQKKQLHKLYYDPRQGYGNVQKVYEAAKLGGLGVTYRQIQNWMEDEYVVQANKPTKKPKHWNSIAAPGPGYNYQMDLIDYTRFRTDGYGWIMCIIDVTSRKAGARAIKAEYTRTGKKSPYAKVKWEQYLEYYKQIVEEDFDGRYPKDLNCDNEFKEGSFKDFVMSKGTRIHFSDPTDITKNAIVERFNRTLELLIQKHRFATDDIDWPTYLDDLVYNYNHRYHSTIKATPEGVWSGKEKSKQKIVWLWNTLKVGDQVRKKLKLNLFAKGDEIRYSNTVYVLVARNGSRWLLRSIKTGQEDDNKGRWYKESQLQKVNKIVDPTTKSEGVEKEAENYALNEKGEEKPSDVKTEKEYEEQREPKEEPSRVDDDNESLEPSKKGLTHSKALQQFALNRRLKKLAKNSSEQPHEDVEEDPDRPGYARFVIPERLKPETSKEERKLRSKRRLEAPKTFSNRTQERRDRKKRKKE